MAQPEVAARRACVDRLADIRLMADADRVLVPLGDADPRVREVAMAAIWRIWCRSSNRAIDKLFARGLGQMWTSALGDALATFSAIVRRK